MSQPAETAIRKGPNWMLTGVGALLVLAIVITVNILAGMSNARFDMTENKVHTLTEGTKNILKRVDTNTTIKFFVSPKDMMPPQLHPAIDQTDAWLARFREVNPEKITVERIETEPATDEQEQAVAAKIQAKQGVIYFGLSITCLDNTSNIDWVPDVLSNDGKEDDRIEYNLAKAISEVTRTKKKKVGLMSALPMEGGMGGREWSMVHDLKSQYEVKKVELTTTTIDEDLDVLVLVHPAGITDEAQFAVDQYLLKGGHLVAFLDSSSYMAAANKPQPNPFQQAPPSGPELSSNLSKLLTPWGFSYDSTKIVADPRFGMPLDREGHLVNPVILSMGPEAIADKHNELTKELTSFFWIFSGAFSGKAATGLTQTIYLQTSEKHGMVSATEYAVDPNSPDGMKKAQELAVKLKPEGNVRILAMSLQGKFQTGFPEGKPAPPPPKPEGGGPPGGGGFPGGGLPPGFPGGQQGAQGPEGPPATPSAAAPAAPAAEPAPAPAPAPAKPIEATTPPITVPAAPTPVPITPATTPPPAPAPITATTPPVSITPGAPAPLPITAAPGDKKNEAPLLPPAAGATPVGATPAPFLKESSKEGLVYLFADSDLIADIQPNFQSHNFALALGAIDQATGDRDLLQVRSRGAATRPFSAIKRIDEAANERIKEKLAGMDAETERITKEINEKKTNKDRNQVIFQAMKELQAKSNEVGKARYQLTKEAKKEKDDVVFGWKWKNVFLPPLMVMLLGIGVFIARRVHTAAH